MIHPDLGFIAAVVNRWAGREVFHAGAFLAENGAWGVLGTREAGKSSLLGQLAAKGVPVFADDALVVEDRTAFAGPRCIDLREGAADWLQQGTDIGMVGNRRRWRVRLPAVPATAPLAGWIVPEWAEHIELRSAPAALRLTLLNASVYLNSADAAGAAARTRRPAGRAVPPAAQLGRGRCGDHRPTGPDRG